MTPFEFGQKLAGSVRTPLQIPSSQPRVTPDPFQRVRDTPRSAPKQETGATAPKPMPPFLPRQKPAPMTAPPPKVEL
jgi:hypothetical protein